jgi:hypothetical protein
MIKADDKLANIVYENIDLLPIVFRFGISQNLGQNEKGPAKSDLYSFQLNILLSYNKLFSDYYFFAYNCHYINT